jgi:hypothetical protein
MPNNCALCEAGEVSNQVKPVSGAGGPIQRLGLKPCSQKQNRNRHNFVDTNCLDSIKKRQCSWTTSFSYSCYRRTHSAWALPFSVVIRSTHTMQISLSLGQGPEVTLEQSKPLSWAWRYTLLPGSYYLKLEVCTKCPKFREIYPMTILTPVHTLLPSS